MRSGGSHVYGVLVFQKSSDTVLSPQQDKQGMATRQSSACMKKKPPNEGIFNTSNYQLKTSFNKYCLCPMKSYSKANKYSRLSDTIGGMPAPKTTMGYFLADGKGIITQKVPSMDEHEQAEPVAPDLVEEELNGRYLTHFPEGATFLFAVGDCKASCFSQYVQGRCSLPGSNRCHIYLG